jgi:UDP-N-acetylglucosamine acyltransferase
MSNVEIHGNSLVHPEAKLGKNVKVGPFCVVGPNVEIGDNTVLHSHVVIDGHTQIGANNKFFQFCSIGAPPQDNSYKGEPTKVIIGENNTFREYVSVHRGTLKQEGMTKIGSNSLFMAYTHFGHDVTVGNNITVANSSNFAGHVTIGDRVIIGGGTMVSQFVTIGRGAYIGGGSGIDKDIPPFFTAYGNRIKIKGINIIGLKRQGHDKQAISDLVDFVRMLEANTLSPRAFVDHNELMSDYTNSILVKEIADFIKKSEIGIPPFMA